MNPAPDRSARRLRRVAVLGVVVAAALIVIVRQRHHDARSSATAGGDDDAATSRGWRNLFGGGGVRTPPLALWRLSGRVVDANNQAVPGAAVHLAVPARVTTSASDGSFAFGDLAAGAYDVDARREDRVGGPVRAHVGPDFKPVVLRLYRGARLELEVVSAADDKPIAGADVEVRVIHMHEGGGTQRGRTGPDGKVLLPGAILIGSEAWAAAAGFLPAFKSLDPAWQVNGSWKARLELQPGGVVSGRVVDENGAPVGGALIEAVASGGGGGGRSATVDSRFGDVNPLAPAARRQGLAAADDGRFQIALPAGGWRLVATHDTHQTGVSERVTSDGKTPRDGILVVARTGLAVRGVVKRADGQPEPGAVVRVLWQSTGRVERTLRADGNGRFRFVGLPPGLLSFLALAPRASSLPLHLDLEYPPKEQLTLELVNDGVITGTVVDADNRPLPDASVVYVEHAESVLMTRVHPSIESTDEAGRFAIHGLSPTAVYTLNIKRAQDGDALFRTASVDAQPGQDVTIRVPGDGSIVGRVVRAGGGSLADVMVEVVDGGRPAQPVSGDGQFRFDGLFARDYTLKVSAASAAFRRQQVTVQPGRVTDAGKIELGAARRLGGVVRTEDGKPLRNAGVTLEVAGDPQPIEITADASGAFSATVPADRAVTARAGDRRLGQSNAVTVQPSETKAITLTFPAVGSVEGTVVAGGKPVAHAAVVASSDEEGAAAVGSAQSDENGYYRIDGLAAGGYLVQLAAGDKRADRVEPQHVKVQVAEKSFANFELPAK